MFISLTALNGTVEHKDGAMVCRLEDEDILELGLFGMKDFFDL